MRHLSTDNDDGAGKAGATQYRHGLRGIGGRLQRVVEKYDVRRFLNHAVHGIAKCQGPADFMIVAEQNPQRGQEVLRIDALILDDQHVRRRVVSLSPRLDEIASPGKEAAPTRVRARRHL